MGHRQGRLSHFLNDHRTSQTMRIGLADHCGHHTTSSGGASKQFFPLFPEPIPHCCASTPAGVNYPPKNSGQGRFHRRAIRNLVSFPHLPSRVQYGYGRWPGELANKLSGGAICPAGGSNWPMRFRSDHDVASLTSHAGNSFGEASFHAISQTQCSRPVTIISYIVRHLSGSVMITR